MKRKYKTVDVVESASGFGVTLDGKPVRTPAGKLFAASSRALAEAVAEEWRAQGDKVDPRSMPMTRFVATALDRVPTERERIVRDLAAFAETDLLCHWVEEPEVLVVRQRENWQPLLDWVAKSLGARFRIAAGVMPVEQPPETLAAIRARVAACDDLMLVVLQTLAGSSGSIVLALAVVEAQIAAEEALRLSRLDEDYQIEHWGEDEESAATRRIAHADLVEAERVLSLVRVRH